MRLFLQGVVSAIRSSGIEEASVDCILEHCHAICHVVGHKKPNWTDFLRSANWLEQNGFIITNDLSNGIYTKGSSSKFIIFSNGQPVQSI